MHLKFKNNYAYQFRKLILLIFLFLSQAYVCNFTDNYWKDQIKTLRKVRIGNNELAIKIGLNIIQNCKNDSINAHAYASLGSLYTSKGDYIKAFESHYKAKEIFSIESHNIKSIIYNGIGLSEVYRNIGLADRALKELETTIELDKKAGSKDHYTTANLHISSAILLTGQKKYISALAQYLIAEQILKRNTNLNAAIEIQVNLSIIYSDIGNIYLLINDLKKAEKFINLAAEALGNIKNFEIEYVNTITLAELYVKTNREKQAIQILNPIVDHPNVPSDFNKNIHELLAQSYTQINDLENAKKERIKVDAIQSLSAQQKSVGLKEAYAYVEKDLKDKDQQYIQHKILLFLLIFCLTLCLVGGIFYYNKKLKNQKKAYHDLTSSIEQSKKIDSKKVKPIDDLEFSKSELELIEKLDKFEQTKGYLKKDLTLAVLAVDLNTNTSYLSEIINKSKNKNINTYINELRINYITTELYNNPKLLNYKISYLAELAGFSSHNNFALVFKKITKISPSVFLDERRKELSQAVQVVI